MPVRPASDSVRSVPSASMRTSSAASNISAIRRIRSPSASQSRSTASKMNSSYSANVMPASSASACVGHSPITHGISSAIVRSAERREHLLERRLALLRQVGAFVRVLRAVDRDHAVDRLPDVPLDRRRLAEDARAAPRGRTARRPARTAAAGSGTRLSARSARPPPRSAAGRDGCRERRPASRVGRPSDRSTSSRAYSSIRGSRRNNGVSTPAGRPPTTGLSYYSSVRRKSSTSSAGSVSMRVEPRAPSATDTFATVAMSGASTTLTKSNSPERRPLVEHLAPELGDVLVHLAEALRIRLEGLYALLRQRRQEDEERHPARTLLHARPGRRREAHHRRRAAG